MLIDVPIARQWYAGAALTYTIHDVALAVIDSRSAVVMAEAAGGNFVALVQNADTLNWPAAFVTFTDKNGLSETVPLFTPANTAQVNSTQIELSAAATQNRTVNINERTTRVS